MRIMIYSNITMVRIKIFLEGAGKVPSVEGCGYRFGGWNRWGGFKGRLTAVQATGYAMLAVQKGDLCQIMCHRNTPRPSRKTHAKPTPLERGLMAAVFDDFIPIILSWFHCSAVETHSYAPRTHQHLLVYQILN